MPKSTTVAATADETMHTQLERDLASAGASANPFIGLLLLVLTAVVLFVLVGGL